jgi:hypothetical protein
VLGAIDIGLPVLCAHPLRARMCAPACTPAAAPAHLHVCHLPHHAPPPLADSRRRGHVRALRGQAGEHIRRAADGQQRGEHTPARRGRRNQPAGVAQRERAQQHREHGPGRARQLTRGQDRSARNGPTSAGGRSAFCDAALSAPASAGGSSRGRRAMARASSDTEGGADNGAAAGAGLVPRRYAPLMHSPRPSDPLLGTRMLLTAQTARSGSHLAMVHAAAWRAPRGMPAPMPSVGLP